jgi:citrate lyase beta subunit
MRAVSAPTRRRSIVLITRANEAMLAAALQSNADVICVDFEDTVSDKPAAHRLAHMALASDTRAEVAVRINPLTTEEGLRDLLMLRAMPNPPKLVKLAKVFDPFEVRLAAEMLPGAELLVIVETAQALERAPEIAAASPRVAGLMLGGKDLSEALGCARNWNGLLYARGRLVQAAAMAGVPAFDEPYRPLDDLAGLADTSRKLVDMGFKGKVAVDLGQVDIINDLFPSGLPQRTKSLR